MGLLQISLVLPACAEQGKEGNPALSAAQRTSGVSSTSQPSQHPPAHTGSSQHPHGQPGHLHGRSQPHDGEPGQHGRTDAKQLPNTRELEELFAVLSSWLGLNETRQGLPLWHM